MAARGAGWTEKEARESGRCQVKKGWIQMSGGKSWIQGNHRKLCGEDYYGGGQCMLPKPN
jgi:hypothetical protein